MIGGLTSGHKDPTANIAIARVARMEKENKRHEKSGRRTGSDGAVADERVPDLCGNDVAGDRCCRSYRSGKIYDVRACTWGKKKIKRQGGFE